MVAELKQLFGDRDLIEKFRAGDREVLDQVYWAYVDRVRHVIQACVSSYRHFPETALGSVDDLIQEVFLRAFNPVAREAYDGTRDYGPYLFTIARNMVKDAFKIRRHEVLIDHQELCRHLESGVSDFQVTDPQWADSEALARIRDYVARLPPDFRALHHSRYILGMSEDAAARTLGMSRQRTRTLDRKLKGAVTRELRGTGS